MTQVDGRRRERPAVPVGAALEVRDRVVGAIQPWTSRPSAERELNRVRRDVRRFERRGTVARNRVVRELRKRRNRVVRGCASAAARPRSRRAAQRRAAHDQAERQARPGPRRPLPRRGGEGRQAAGRPRAERAAEADEAGKGPRAAVRLSFGCPAADQVSVGPIRPSGHAGRKQQSNLSSLSRRALRGPSVFLWTLRTGAGCVLGVHRSSLTPPDVTLAHLRRLRPPGVELAAVERALDRALATPLPECGYPYPGCPPPNRSPRPCGP